MAAIAASGSGKTIFHQAIGPCRFERRGSVSGLKGYVVSRAGATGPASAEGNVAPMPTVSVTVTTDGPNRGSGTITAAVTATKPKFLRPNFEKMPAELKQLKNWVLWYPRWTGSKWTKVPIQPSGFGSSTINPKHWSSFDGVKQAYERAIERIYIEVHERGKPKRRAPIGGVGFVFDGQSDRDGLVYAGADFDSGAFRGEIASFTEERLKKLGSYFEASVSGSGLHVIVKAHPLTGGVAHNGIELYTTKRFFTMTGRTSATERPIVAATKEFAALAEVLRNQGSKSGGEPREARQA